MAIKTNHFREKFNCKWRKAVSWCGDTNMSKWRFLVQISNDGNMSYPRLPNETPRFESGLQRKTTCFLSTTNRSPCQRTIQIKQQICYISFSLLWFAPSMDRNLSLCILPNRLYINNLFDITDACLCLSMGNMSIIYWSILWYIKNDWIKSSTTSLTLTAICYSPTT